jgi:hypothetical protein
MTMGMGMDGYGLWANDIIGCALGERRLMTMGMGMDGYGFGWVWVWMGMGMDG